MKAKLYSGILMRSRFRKAARQMECANLKLAKQGKAEKKVDESITEIVFIAFFLPFWDPKVLRKKECYLNEKYGI